MEQTEVVASAAGTSENTSAGTAPTEAMAVDAHAEDASEPTTTDGTASSEATASAATEEPIPADETPEQKNARRQRQREARKQAAATAAQDPSESPPPPKTPAEIIAEHEAQQRAAYEAQQKRQAEQQRYARYIGEDPVDPSNPQSPTRYQQLLAEASTAIPDGDDQFYTEETRQLVAKVNKARQQLAELNERRGMLSEVYTPAQQAAQLQARDWLGNELERGIAELGLNVPEVLSSVQGIKDPNALIPQIVKTMGEKIRAAAIAPLNEKIEDLEDDLAAERSENDALRRQLGGAAPQALRGGSVAAGGALTYETYMAMDPNDRMKLRSTPEGRARIDAMTRGAR